MAPAVLMVSVPAPLVEALTPVVPPVVVWPAPVEVKLTSPPAEVTLTPTPAEDVITSAEVTATVLLLLAVAEMPPVVPLMVPPETSTVTAPEPLPAVPVAETPRPALPVTPAPV